MIKPIYKENFISKSWMTYETLMEIDWVQRENTPRKEYWDTTLGNSYTYGSGMGERTYLPNEPTQIVSNIRRLVEEETGILFEGCFLNRYDTGKDALGWHSDDDKGIDHTAPIIVVTVGQGREIQWKEIGTKGIENIHSQFLDDGSMFIMPAGMQQTHLHRIPKAGYEVSKSRISLTFRKLL